MLLHMPVIITSVGGLCYGPAAVSKHGTGSTLMREFNVGAQAGRSASWRGENGLEWTGQLCCRLSRLVLAESDPGIAEGLISK